MERTIRTLLLIAFVVLLCLTNSHAAEIQPIDQQGCPDPYSLINKASFFPVEEEQLTIRLYETGGGDPAMNGNKIVRNIRQCDPSGNNFTWNAGVDIYELVDVRLERGKIRLECTEHVMDNTSGTIKTEKTIYLIGYFQDESEQLKTTIDVAKQEQ